MIITDISLILSQVIFEGEFSLILVYSFILVQILKLLTNILVQVELEVCFSLKSGWASMKSQSIICKFCSLRYQLSYIL